MLAGTDRSYKALGYRFRVRARTGLVDEMLHEHLLPFAVDGERRAEPLPSYELVAENGGYLSRLDGEVLGEHLRPALPALQLLWRVTCEAIPTAADRLAFHAGAVSIDGRAVVLPGPSGSGKSTLTAALVQSGAAYLSDEVALIDNATVDPFPRSLALKKGAAELLRLAEHDLSSSFGDPAFDEQFIAPDDLRPGAVGTSCPLSLVVFPTYERGAPLSVEPISRGAGLVQLMGNSFNFVDLGGGALERLADSVRSADFYRLRSGTLGDAVAAVRSLAHRE